MKRENSKRNLLTHIEPKDRTKKSCMSKKKIISGSNFYLNMNLKLKDLIKITNVYVMKERERKLNMSQSSRPKHQQRSKNLKDSNWKSSTRKRGTSLKLREKRVRHTSRSSKKSRVLEERLEINRLNMEESRKTKVALPRK
jgi:hypothetical protein